MSHGENLRLDRFAVQSLREREAVLRRQLTRARASLDPDAVHDLRVAIRRMRACLEAFPTVFRAKRVERLRRKLRRIFHLAGAVRDTDIAAELHQAGGKRRRRLAKTRRNRARRLRRQLGKKKARKLLRRVQAVAQRTCQDDRDAGETAAKSLSLDLAQLFEQGRQAVAAEAEPPELHRLRIAVKKMRYRAEVFLLLLGPDASSAIEDLSEMQTALGEIQDCATALKLLRAGAADARADIETRQLELRREFYRDWRERVDAPGALERRQQRLLGPSAVKPAATAFESST